MFPQESEYSQCILSIKQACSNDFNLQVVEINNYLYQPAAKNICVSLLMIFILSRILSLHKTSDHSFLPT